MVGIDRDGNKADPSHPYDVNPAGYVIHSAVLNVRSDIFSVIHHHSLPGIAVAGLKEGLLPVSQHALQFYNRDRLPRLRRVSRRRTTTSARAWP